eukprot:TRINITY_DN537_c0_g1_i6.p1 TRINITY_DN537_c0_g1~~TRINITY_DN537_c0_g1_i6.p1  ORF type:complete len:281 (+),score=48.10 TRINITY_DN537_c0_g1_i6:118-960(+)
MTSKETTPSLSLLKSKQVLKKPASSPVRKPSATTTVGSKPSPKPSLTSTKPPPKKSTTQIGDPSKPKAMSKPTTSDTPQTEESPATTPTTTTTTTTTTSTDNAVQKEDTVIEPSPSSSSGSSKKPVGRVKTYINWKCNLCEGISGGYCVPVREESRCLCGHRNREHNQGKGSTGWECKASKCTCKSFFYIMAEGSWILRCRCKHKHTEHDPKTPGAYKCVKPSCKCENFISSFVCNCNHPWKDHSMSYTERSLLSPFDMMNDTATISTIEQVKRGEVDEP